MIFSRRNPPPGFYHYLYLREDGTPYYSGKGSGKRAWATNHIISLPEDHSRIIITHWNLTELWALALERWYIRWYGRKDNGTGILRNLTDGGEGTVGRRHSKETCELFSKQRKGKHLVGIKRSAEHKKSISNGRKGVSYGPLSSEHKKNISESIKGENHPMFGKKGKDNPNFGRKRTDEIISKTTGAGNGMFNKTHSVESIKQMKESIALVPKLTCQHCGNVTTPAMNTRWHGDNCRVKLN